VSRSAWAARLGFAFALALVAMSAGCSWADALRGKGADAGSDAGPAVLTFLDAQPPPPPAPPVAFPVNVNQVARFPDEVMLHGVEAKVMDPQVTARNSVPSGAPVATLRLGTPVKQIARHESFVLCEFTDPKTAGRLLEGWLGEQAFVAGPSVPRKTPCTAGQTLLVFEDQDFCGRTCKTDADCPSDLACVGKANLVTSGKPGAETATCTVRSAGEPGPSSFPTPSSPSTDANGDASAPRPRRRIPFIRLPPGPGGICQTDFVLGIDGACHLACPHGDDDCPVMATCSTKVTEDRTPVCVHAAGGAR
jgi:hypothetical protein